MTVIGEHGGHRVTVATHPGPAGTYESFAHCTCGWRGAAFEHRQDAVDDARRHLESEREP